MTKYGFFCQENRVLSLALNLIVESQLLVLSKLLKLVCCLCIICGFIIIMGRKARYLKQLRQKYINMTIHFIFNITSFFKFNIQQYRFYSKHRRKTFRNETKTDDRQTLRIINGKDYFFRRVSIQVNIYHSLPSI